MSGVSHSPPRSAGRSQHVSDRGSRASADRAAHFLALFFAQKPHIEAAVAARFRRSAAGAAAELRPEDVEDVIQTVYCQLWEEVCCRPVRFADLTPDSAVRLLATIAFRRACDLSRRKRVRGVLPLAPEPRLPAPAAGPDRAMDRPDVRRLLAELGGVRGKANTVLYLLLAGCELEHVAAEIHVSTSYCAKLRWRGVRRLRTVMSHNPALRDRLFCALA